MSQTGVPDSRHTAAGPCVGSVTQSGASESPREASAWFISVLEGQFPDLRY